MGDPTGIITSFVCFAAGLWFNYRIALYEYGWVCMWTNSVSVGKCVFTDKDYSVCYSVCVYSRIRYKNDNVNCALTLCVGKAHQSRPWCCLFTVVRWNPSPTESRVDSALWTWVASFKNLSPIWRGLFFKSSSDLFSIVTTVLTVQLHGLRKNLCFKICYSGAHGAQLDRTVCFCFP